MKINENPTLILQIVAAKKLNPLLGYCVLCDLYKQFDRKDLGISMVKRNCFLMRCNRCKKNKITNFLDIAQDLHKFKFRSILYNKHLDTTEISVDLWHQT